MTSSAPPQTAVRGIVRTVGAVTFCVEVAADDDARAQIDDAFADLVAIDPSVEPQIVVRVTSDVRSDGAVMYQIAMPGHPPWRTDAPTAVVDHIVTTLSRLALDAEPDRLHLHAGLLTDGDDAVLVVGPSGAGKSTIVAASTQAGLTYITDEMVGVDPASGELSGLTKPITLKNHSWDLFTDVLGERPVDGERWAVRASRLGSIEVGGSYRPRLLVFPRFVVDAPVRITELHPATGLLRLLTDNLDMERYGSAGLEVLARLVMRSTVLEVEYGDAAAAVTAFRSHVVVPRAGDEAPIVVPPTVGISPDGLTRRAPSTASVVLNGRAVLYDEACGQMAELDEAASLWWLGLDGVRSPEALAEQFAEATSGETIEIMVAAQKLFAELSKAGFLL